MSRLLTALSRLGGGETYLDQEQTNWLRRQLQAEGVVADAHTGIAQVWIVHIEGDLDEQARAVIELPLKGCGRVELMRGERHVDASDSQEEIVWAQPAQPKATQRTPEALALVERAKRLSANRGR